MLKKTKKSITKQNRFKGIFILQGCLIQCRKEFGWNPISGSWVMVKNVFEAFKGGFYPLCPPRTWPTKKFDPLEQFRYPSPHPHQFWLRSFQGAGRSGETNIQTNRQTFSQIIVWCKFACNMHTQIHVRMSLHLISIQYV